jgi:rubredoxin
MKTFEGSYLGDRSKIASATRLECKVCWYVYDPAQGDPLWQVPPGTPFADLPAHWTCPNCACPQDQFMVLPDD